MPAKVLLVDDDHRLLLALARALRREPYELFTAVSALEAEAIVKQWSIDLVVTDEHMPGRRGTELLAWMARVLPATPRIVLTGSLDPQTAMRAVNEGRVFRYFSKPCPAPELAAAIRAGLKLRELAPA